MPVGRRTHRGGAGAIAYWARMAVPVTVVTGFLGAGKSTAIDRWLRDLDDVAVVINEQGEVGIDGALLAARARRLREITGGCVCCTTQAELAAALSELADAGPARILVETSGAASPAGVVRVLTRLDPALRLDGIVTVVDAARIERALSFDLAVEQLGFADVVILGHADEVEAEALAAVERRVLRHAPGAVLATATRGEGPALDDLLARRREELRLPPAMGAHRVIDAVSMVVAGELDEDRFGDWVEGVLGPLEARILRVKGILAFRGVEERVILQGVGEAIEVTPGRPWGEAPRESRLVVLGLGLDAAPLEAGLRACAAP
jgi:G3E family GTPase